jgi:hypothetical protein
MPEPDSFDAAALLDMLAGSGRRVVLVATGGGSAAIPALVATPGAPVRWWITLYEVVHRRELRPAAACSSWETPVA